MLVYFYIAKKKSNSLLGDTGTYNKAYIGGFYHMSLYFNRPHALSLNQGPPPSFQPQLAFISKSARLSRIFFLSFACASTLPASQPATSGSKKGGGGRGGRGKRSSEETKKPFWQGEYVIELRHTEWRVNNNTLIDRYM